MKRKDRQDLLKKTTELIDIIADQLDNLREEFDANVITWVTYDKKKNIYTKLQSALYLEVQLLSELEDIEND